MRGRGRGRGRGGDVTARNPLAAKYLNGSAGENSSTINGYSCKVGEKEKATRYPDLHGLHCITAAIETFGRISPAFDRLLDELAAAAATRDANRALPPLAWKRRWLAKLSTGMQRAVAMNILDSVGSSVRDGEAQ